MTDPCKQTFEYPSYECYKEIKRQFVERTLDISTYIKQFEEKHAPHIKHKLNGLSDVYTEFKKYLSNSAVFASTWRYNGKGTCKYISYLLCDKISNNYLYGECNEEKFNIFKEFLRLYNNKGSNICKDMLERLDNKEFLKVKALYELYDKYYLLAIQHTHVNSDYCQDMQYLVRIYNNFMNRYPSRTSQFYDALKKFKALMDTITETGRKRCKGEHFSIREPIFFNPELIQPPPTRERENKQSQGDTLDKTGISEHSKVTSLPTSVLGEVVGENPKNEKGPDVLYPLTATDTLVSHKTLVEQHPHKTLEPYEQRKLLGMPEPYVSQGYHGPERSHGPHAFLETESTFSQGKDNFASTNLKEHRLINEDASLLGKIQDTFSGIVQNVDPVPVVGVSGGMGALFLLFRYTPFGTFFRGGRGRAHRIPRSFNGQFLGTFPDMQDYGGGYVGYSPMDIPYLAE